MVSNAAFINFKTQGNQGNCTACCDIPGKNVRMALYTIQTNLQDC